MSVLRPASARATASAGGGGAAAGDVGGQLGRDPLEGLAAARRQRATCCAASPPSGRRRRSPRPSSGSQAFDRAALVLPAVSAIRRMAARRSDGTLASAGDRAQRLTRALRDALHARAAARCSPARSCWPPSAPPRPSSACSARSGASTARWPASPARPGGFTIDKVAGPVGEALVMTAFGLAVAIPAVLAYNVFGRVIGRIEAELEGFAHDLLAQFGDARARRRCRPRGRCRSRPESRRWPSVAARSAAGSPSGGRATRRRRPAPAVRHQRDAAGRRDAGAAGDLHHHRAADGQLDPARPAAQRRRRSPTEAPTLRQPGGRRRRARCFSTTSRSTTTNWPTRLAAGRRAQPATPKSSCAPTSACPTAASSS